MNSVQLAQKMWEQYLKTEKYDVPDVENYIKTNAIRRVDARIELFRKYVDRGLLAKAKMLEITPIKDGSYEDLV